MPRPLLFCLACLLGCIWQTGCVEDTEGCLDLEATNFQVDADIDCIEPCCQYPALSLQVQHRITSAELPDSLQLFRYATPYRFLPDSSFAVSFDTVRFYAHDFVLERADGSELAVRDELTINTPTDGLLLIRDDIVRIDRAEFGGSELGELRPSGTVTGLRFRVGLPNAWALTAPTEFPEGHPLRVTDADPNYTEGVGFTSLLAALRLPATAADSSVVRILEEIPVSLTLDEPVLLSPGQSVTITLRLDYSPWLDGLPLGSATPADISSQIVAALSNSFSLIAVEQE